MKTNNTFLNALFENLSSVYSKDTGQINSQLFVLFNAYANVFQNIDDIRLDTYNNTYLNLSNTDVLEDNFSPYVDFPKPPRLNTVTDGGEIYRAILRSLYDAFLNGSTEESMDVGLSTVLSFLTIDEETDAIITENNNVFFDTYATNIKLAYPAVSSSGTAPALTDFSISPSGLTVTGYNVDTRTISFTGDIPISGQSYIITYSREHSNQTNTNWINFTDPNETSPLPTDLNTIENTYRNPKFSYWWNTYNRDGNGVQIIDGTLEESEQGLVWRLPEKYISYKDPYTQNDTSATIDAYNLNGSAYDINSSNKEVNPDFEQTTSISSYVDQISRNPDDYYIRYSQNNSIFTPLEEFIGGVTQVEKVSDMSVNFASDNFGTLDFFEKGVNFDLNDIFGFGTKNVWTNVSNINGYYSLSVSNYFNRPYSLHETILFKEIFENGNRSLNRFPSTVGNRKLTETINTPIEESSDSLQLYGSNTSVYPVISTGLMALGNTITIDMLDNTFSSNVTSDFQCNLIDPNNNNISGVSAFRFVIPQNIETSSTIIGASGNVVQNTIPFNFIETYFPNIDEANYAVTSNNGIFLDSGNENINQSSYHLETSGASVLNFNLENFLQNNTLMLEISKDNDYSINFYKTSPIPDAAGNYTRDTLTLYYYYTSQNFAFSYQTVYLREWLLPTVSYGSFGGGGIISPDINPSKPTSILRFKKGENLTIDGVMVPFISPLDNLGVINDDNSISYGPSKLPFHKNSIILNTGIDTELHYLFVGDEVRAEFFKQSDFSSQYYYQIAYSGESIDDVFKNTLSVPRKYGWHRLNFTLGPDLNQIIGRLDNFEFVNIDLPFSGNFGFVDSFNDSRALTLNHVSNEDDESFSSFYDNFKYSYYIPTQIRPEYAYNDDFTKNWQGSHLDQSAVLNNKIFEGTRQANFIFELTIKGLQNKFIYIIQDLVNKLKPAHTLTNLNIQTDNMLNTTSLVSQYIGDERNWETGNLLDSIYVTDEVNTDDILDLPGTITVSGSSI